MKIFTFILSMIMMMDSCPHEQAVDPFYNDVVIYVPMVGIINIENCDAKLQENLKQVIIISHKDYDTLRSSSQISFRFL
jgi:hypothetical protein